MPMFFQRTFCSIALAALAAVVGCGKAESVSPQTGELDRYLQENPDAAQRGGQAEPAGFNGPEGGPG